MKPTVALLVSLSLVACGKKASEAPPAAGSSAAKPADPAAKPADPAAKPTDPAAKPGGAAAKAKPAPVKLTKEARAEYKRRLQAGRKLAKAAKWPEALAELEAALAAIPNDDRVLAELSYAYMASGDRDKARAAGRAAVLAATEPKIKAAALYNLGRNEEADAPDKAAALYRESLALRPNQIVEKRLADLAGRISHTPEPPACSTPMPEAKLCACLAASVADMFSGGASPECRLDPTEVDGFELVRYQVSDTGEEKIDVVARTAAGVAVVASLAYVYNPGMFGISEEWTLGAVREEQLGGRTIVRFESSKERQDSDMGVDEIETESSSDLLVCVRDPKGGLPTCPLDVTVEYKYVRDRLGMAEGDDLADMADLQTKGLPIQSETKLDVTLGADGIAKIRVERGRAEPDVIGDKRLW